MRHDHKWLKKSKLPRLV